jgi:16S rRNA (cytidine1402-2'-O)-methyltransferase
LVREAREAGIRVSPVPGPSAVTTLLSVAGLEQVQFVFLGFPPIGSKDRKRWLDRLVAAHPVAIFYEAPHRIAATLGDIQRRMGDVPIIVGRELTKAHEELVVGPISVVIERFSEPKGEFVVAIEVGQKTDYDHALRSAQSADVAAEFSRLTKIDGLTRRQAIAAISRRHGLTAREVYARVEAAKTSVS